MDMAKKKPDDRKKLLIAIAAVLSVLVFLAIFTIFFSRGEKVPSNPAGTVGNLSGNINNGGLLCESGGRIYFSNPYDGGALYSMNVDETDCKKVSTAVANSICVAGNYIYFFQSGSSGASGLGGVRTPNSFIRCHLDGSKGVSMSRQVVVRAQLVGDYVYMEGTADDTHDRPYFFRMDTAGKEEENLANFGINPACAQGDFIYYNGTVADHYLYAYNTINGSSSLLLEDDTWNPVIDGDYIYYMCPSEGYQLRRYSMSSGSVEILVKEKVESFNVYKGYVYFQTFGDDPHLAFMLADGSTTPVVLVNGVFNSISMTNGYVYFRDYFNEAVLYHTFPGSPSYSQCDAAKEAAMENVAASK